MLILAILVGCFFSMAGTAEAVTADEPIAGYSMVTPAQLDADHTGCYSNLSVLDELVAAVAE